MPACLLTGWFAARNVGDVQARNAESVVATFPAKSMQGVLFPLAGTYWVFGAGSRKALAHGSGWEVSAWNDSTRERARIDMPSADRTERRENRSALDLLFTIQVPSPGSYTLRLTPGGEDPGPVQLRITRFSQSTAGTAMKAFGLASLFSLLLVVSAVVWFRTANG
ncbi:MAG: hypothetical protein ACT4P7_20545 [Gemmatimonadaceae bacterium]